MTEITDTQRYMQTLGQNARAASAQLTRASTEQKNNALLAIYAALQQAKAEILAANVNDMTNGRDKGLDDALLDRLELTEGRFEGMLQGLKDVASLPDPIGEVTDMTFRPSGIQLGKMRVPLGVVGMIYESRPNVTIEAASLALKSGNAIILRGGSEAFFSNQALAQCVKQGLKTAQFPVTAVQVIETTDRAAVGEMITMTDYVDVIIPRGGKSLIERISQEAKVPVIKHLDGNCHTYVDENSDLKVAIDICVNAKTSRYGTCNTMETLLVHEGWAWHGMPAILRAMAKADSNMSFRVCEESFKILKDETLNISLATEEDWYEEYLAPILAVKVVKSLDEAINHINHYSSHHTEAIVTNNYEHSLRFMREVDSSSVMVNASTRFADGFEYGLGAEIGISTDKIHARGPVGLEGLTSQKWIVFGHGEIRK